MTESTPFTDEFVNEQKELWRSLKIQSSRSLEARSSHVPSEDGGDEGLYCPRVTKSYPAPSLIDDGSDEDVIEEQRQILAQIQLENERKAKASIARQGPSRLSSLSTTSNGSVLTHAVDYVPDHCLQRDNQRVTVKGTDRTIQSIASGSSVLVQCSSCFAILQVGETVKHVYCTSCKAVTPMNQARQVSNARAGATDELISKSLQRQERAIAMQRKADLVRNSPVNARSSLRN